MKRLLALAAAVVLLAVQSERWVDAQAPCANPIACENAKTGNPSTEWDVVGAGDPSIQGFATDISVNHGQVIRFKVNSTASNYRIDIYRLGYYAGLGARKVATVQPSVALPQAQPACLSDAATGLTDCGNWAVSASWGVPADAVSGLYIAKLVRESGAAGASHVPFIVRDDEGRSDLLFQTSDTTWQAYNDYGGNSLYVGSPAGRAYKVSYNRPFNTRENSMEDWLFNAEYPMLRWLEANGYNVSYTTDVDTDRRGSELLEHKVFMSVGHDEYWSAAQRANVEAARSAGIHLAFWSGNEIFWKTRWENAIDGSGTAYRTLVSYKETHENAVIDPEAPTWTGTWRDARFSPPGDGGRPENALSGNIFTVNGYDSRSILVPASDGKMRFWRNTSIATLAPGATATLPMGTLGYEWDEDLDNGFRPAGIVRLSTATYDVPSRLQDNGSTYGPGLATHHLTLYRHVSGALVFGAGTQQWSWGLDANHDFPSDPPDARMQQATVNLFADMGVQPATLDGILVAATASTDATAPTSTITSPTSGATLQPGTSVTITGTAGDTGGQVGGIEVSVDGGLSWHPVNGRAAWSYAWTPPTGGFFTIKSRAVDDSGNIESPSSGVTVNVQSTGGSGCPCTIWTAATANPAGPEEDTRRVELGVKFRPLVDGTITGIRFYKFSGNTGTHVGTLWSRTGTKLATTTFSGESASGWQQVNFATPVAVTANTTYVASYHTNTGRYAANSQYFAGTSVTNGPIQALADGVDGANGVFRYSTGVIFPNQAFEATNYWVDVVFNTSVATDITSPKVTAVSPVNGATGVAIASSVTAAFNEAMSASSISSSTFELRDSAGALVAASVTYNAGTRTATLTPTTSLIHNTTYTATVKGGASGSRVTDTSGNAMAANASWSFMTVAGVDTTPPTVTSTTPVGGATGVSVSTNVTASFSEAMNGATINGSTFELRDASTSLIPSSVTYNGTTRVATLTPAVALAQGQTYTATVKGGGADPRVKDAASNALASNVSWSFTTATSADTTPPAITTVSPSNGSSGVATTASANATFSEALDPSTVTTNTFELRNPANTLVSASVSYNAATRTATLTPTAALANSTTYTASLRGGTTDPRVKDAAGNALAATFTWSFTTAAAPPPPGSGISIWTSAATPAGVDHDSNAVEVGVKFRADVAGYVTALRFYKFASNTGTHTGHLWTATGTLLATATFTNETASGWQQVDLASPVSINANTTYIASYYAPVGQYAVNDSYFAAGGVDSGPLHALAEGVDGGNGVYRYGMNGSFPNQTFNSTNYWVDLVFASNLGPDTTPPTVITTAPSNGATGVPVTSSVAATLSEPIDPATVNSATFELRDTLTGSQVAGSVTYTAATRTATLAPAAALMTSRNYTATLKGGGVDPRVKDVAGNALASNVVWTFTTAAGTDTTPPTVTSASPSNGATGVGVATTVTVTFNEAMDAATIGSSSFELRNSANALISSTVTYNSATRVATLTPASALANSATYTATVKGGTVDPRVKDAAGNALAANFVSSFTTAAAPTGCPCSIWSSNPTPAGPDHDTSALELGVKFRADVNGYITGLRFYKFSTNVGTHTGHLWTASGTLLAAATFTNETASGWQQVNLATPVAISANTTYVASYYAPVGQYAINDSYFQNAGFDNGPLHALSDAAGGGNGVYRYGTNGSFPNQTFNATNYWVDVVFATSVAADTTPPVITSVSPKHGALGVNAAANITIVFSEAMDPSTINGTTIQLRNGAGSLVTAALTFSAGTATATLDPAATLAYSSTYTLTVKGGAADPRVKDGSGNALAANYVASFTTAAAPPPPPEQGPGGPILVITSAGSPYSSYYAEILRAEGLNEFAVADISTVSAATLASYDLAILADMPVTTAQVSMFGSWVNGGGNLILMRPDKKFLPMLGLTDLSATLANGYLLVNTSTAPGTGIVSETMQFHGTADVYGIGGATNVADLYSDALVSTPNPAVTLNIPAPGAGMAAAFTYDLARSIVYTRQGNIAWSGQERDGFTPMRSDDLFFGGKSTDFQRDWIDLNKVAIPQADEQQRLLVNLILHMNRSRRPLPRFWYLPRGVKAAVVMTGDDHAAGGTAGRFDAYKAASPAGCSVSDWECIRGTSYIYPNTPITNSAAAVYTADGFEIGLHLSTNCADWTPASLQNFYTDQLNTFATTFPAVPAPTTNRTHCIVWSDYATQPAIELAHGIRLDTSYYYWPASWVNDRPGFFTGSGIPMRFANASGAMIDVYQAATQMTDESGQTFPFTVNALLDKALGPEGYYGVFTANMHTDLVSSPGSDAIVASAKARGVPVVTARQMLEWLDGRNGSSFQGLTWSGNNLTFTVAVGAGAGALQVMLPRTVQSGTLTNLTVNGTPVPFVLRTIKGIEYALFQVSSGTYQAAYVP